MATNDMKLSRSFAWLNVTQFLGAFNDNVFRLLIVFFLVEGLKHDGTKVLATAMTVFVTPFLLFSHTAGVLADRVSKRTIIVFAKWAEVFVMVLGCIAIYFGITCILYALIFLMATQSALFGPSKYGIIPELVGHDRLSKANSFLVSLSYLGIILGTFVPSFGLDVVLNRNYFGLALLCVVVAVAGVAASLRIEKTPAAGTGKKFSPLFVRKIFLTLKDIRPDRDLFLAVLGVAYFLFLGAFLNQNLVIYGKEVLGLDWIKSGYLFPAAALGIGIGALVSGKVSGRNIEMGIVPVGALGLTVCMLALGFIPLTIATVIGVMFITGISAGLYIVPLNAFIQYRSPLKRRGEILACTNFLSFLGAALSAGAIVVFHKALKFDTSQCFIVIGALTGILALVAIVILPDFLVRFVIVFITRTFYRIRTVDPENVPIEGAALLISNHVTWVDALLITATQQRRIRFIMGREIYNNRWLNPLFRLMKIIPISPTDPPRQVIASLKEARSALDEGYLVCIFAEGGMTRNGNMRGFKHGLERIVKGTDYPIIPVHIGGAWGSVFSYYRGRILSAFPRTVPYPVSVIFGEPIPASSPASEIRQAVMELSGRSFGLFKSRNRTLAKMFVRTARTNWFRTCMSDTTGKRLTFGRALTASIALSVEIDEMSRGQDKIGVVLPASVGGALTNIAVTMLGKVAVNLNFTTSAGAVESAVRQCGIKTVISSRAFLEKLESFSAPKGTVFLEDMMPRITGGRKFAALLKALFAPAHMLARFRVAGPDDLATVIFSSGSTAEPKGIMLSHHNIISDIESFTMVFRFSRKDNICAVLPLFHSFGFTCTLWCPVTAGFSTSYHANPVDGAKIAEVVRENCSTILMTTPTFLLAYIRRVKREDFATLRAVIVGAEKLKQRVADSFEDRFGIRPLEGYGTTELSPVVSVNIPDVEVGGVRQVGTKEGSVGHPIPCVVVKVVDPENGVTLPEGEEGLLMVKGPNVMMGYLNDPAKTAEVLHEGWYNTGDIAKMDNDGFVFLLDRMSRYSKIGGEMVPHIAVEEKLLETLGTISPVVAVTSAPDEKKGEQLVVLYTDEAGEAGGLQKIVGESNLPNLWKPRSENYFRIDSMPTLGSGKLDLKRLKEIAREFVEKKKHKWEER